ncbi:hypothetical protein HA402_015983 [Bradysia odoriphaga]|nr:hypothetical protein HA402_015983 [Bradysia odoriphaga]
MEAIISNLLVPDNLVVQKATAELKEAFKHPEAISSLCQIIVASEKPEIRQYAAVLLRKHIAKLRVWQTIPPELQIQIKQGTLNAILNESVKSVRNSIAQIIGVLVKHEFAKKDAWTNEVLSLIFQYTRSDDAQKSELGSSVFEILTDTSPDQFLPHMEPICEMFSAAMVAIEASGNMTTPVILNILLGMGHLVPFILGHNGAEITYQKSIPYVVKALQAFAQQKPDEFVKAFEILEYMADFTPKLLTPHLSILIEFSLNAARNPEFENQVRVRVVQFIGWLVKLKKKAILKNKLLEPIIGVVFMLMATPSEDGDSDDEDSDAEDDYFTGNENSNPRTTATQTMDLLALHVPPEKLIPPLLQYIEPALQNRDPNQKKAAYLCLAVIAEGCGEAIIAKYLQIMLNCIKVGIVDPDPLVRNAALFALGQFSEHLQPEISKFADEVLPILFEFLHQLCLQLRAGTSVKHVDRMFYALETYCENLEDALVPHLPVLMERLFETLRPENTVHLRELSMSCVASAAKAAKSQMLPYFQQIIEVLKVYLVRSDNEDIVEIRPQAIDTLAALARTIGKENFMPLTTYTMEFALSMLDEASEPELRSSLYNLFAAIAEVVNAEMAPVLQKIVDRMLDSVKSSDDILPEFKDESVAEVDGQDENAEIDIENSEDEDDDDEDEYAGFSVVNSFLDEKEEAVLALKQLAEFSGPAFLPYITPCFENIYKLLDHSSEDIRKSALEALAQFIVTLNQNNDDAGVQHGITIFVPKAAEIIKSDDDCQVVMTALDTYGTLLKETKQKVIFNEELKMTVFTCIQNVLNSKVSCQLYDDQAEDDDQEESEYDEALIQVAGEVLPKFGAALSPDEFAVYFKQIVPILAAKIEKSKNNEDLETQRSFAYGTLSECFQPLKNRLGEWFETLLPAYLHGLQDSFEQVRHNCVYGLGELVLHSGEVAYSKFPVILSALSEAVAQEQHPGTLDNICGALARLIMANFTLIPLEQVLPVFIQKLPLREDFDENLTIFKGFTTLWTQQHEALLSILDGVIMCGLHVLHKNQYKDDEARNVIFNLLQEIRLRYSDRFNQIVNTDATIVAFVQSW